MGLDVIDFESEVLKRSASIPVVLDFWAEWCGPCKILTPVLESLAEKHQGEWELKKLDTEKFSDIALQYGIQSIPNVKMFVDGKVVNEFVGAMPESTIERWLKSVLPDKFQNTLDEAEAHISAQRFPEARLLIESVLHASPSHDRARALMGLALVFSDPRKALDSITIIEEGSRYGEYAATVRTLCSLIGTLENPSGLPQADVRQTYLEGIRSLSQGHFAEALKLFIEVIKKDRYYEDDGSRKACIAVFKFLGEENDITLRYRREFGNALYV